MNNPDTNYLATSNYKFDRFIAKQLPQVFRDSLDGTVVSLRIYNEYGFSAYGPPFIPVFPIREGYGYSEKYLNRTDTSRLKNVVVELEIDPGKDDTVTFDTSFFYMVSRESGKKSFPRPVDSLPLQSATVRCIRRTSWKILFSPGMKVKDRPVVYLQSLRINGKQFHPDGIPFRIGKKSFYSVIISING